MSNLTKQLAETVTQSGVRTSYGEPVEMDGTVVMPVAISGYGFGGGEGGGSGPESTVQGEGSGGGGGGLSVPVGAYVTRDGYTRFEPNIIALLTVAVPFVCVSGRALARVIRALKR